LIQKAAQKSVTRFDTSVDEFRWTENSSGDLLVTQQKCNKKGLHRNDVTI